MRVGLRAYGGGDVPVAGQLATGKCAIRSLSAAELLGSCFGRPERREHSDAPKGIDFVRGARLRRRAPCEDPHPSASAASRCFQFTFGSQQFIGPTLGQHRRWSQNVFWEVIQIVGGSRANRNVTEIDRPS